MSQIVIEDSAHVSEELFFELGAAECPVDVGHEVTVHLADIPPFPAVHDGMHRLLFQQELQPVGELDFAALVGLGAGEAVEDARREKIPPDDREIARGLVYRRFFDQLADAHFPGRDLVTRNNAVLVDLALGDGLDSKDAGSVLFVSLDHGLGRGETGIGDIVAEEDRERLGADMVAGLEDGVTESEGLALPDIMDVGEVGDRADLLELVRPALRPEEILELERLVEMVLDGPLAPSGDYEYVPESGGDSFLDDVLDCGFVHNREHLLGLGLGRGEEAGTESGGGDNCFFN